MSEERKLLDELEYEDAKKFFYAATIQIKYNSVGYEIMQGKTIPELFQTCWVRIDLVFNGSIGSADTQE